MDWIGNIAALLGGGILVEIYHHQKNKGKLDVNDCSVELHYIQDIKLITHLQYFKVTIQFINTSGYTKTFHGLKCKYFDGKQFNELEIKDHDISPAGLIEARHIENFQLVLFTIGETNVDLLSIHDNEAYFEISYKQDKADRSITIHGHEFKLINDAFRSVVG